MRKRAQRRSKLLEEEPKHIAQKSKFIPEIKQSKTRKNWWIAVALLGIFLMVLFFNTYFNFTSGQAINPEGTTLSTKFYLSGPDPYYNMRMIEGTMETGHYAFYSEPDPLLNYPIGKSGGRPPLFNMMAIGFSRLLSPFMDEIDAVGYSMQFVPALFGALLVIPVYFIGAAIFGKRAGIIAALFTAIIPIHLSSGHGSAYSLFDHDSFNLLLYFLTFMFLVKAIKEKDTTRSFFFAVLAGIPLAGLSMTWVEARFLYVVIALYAIIQMVVDIFISKINYRVGLATATVLSTGYLVSLPVTAAKLGGFRADIPLFLAAGIGAFAGIYYLFGRKKIPWTISLPAVFSIGGIGLFFLYFIQDIVKIMPFLSGLTRLSSILYGSGIYGSKVSMTIAEANTYNISHTVMSFGPVLYWLGFFGFVLLAYYFYKNNQKREYLFILVLFLLSLWLTGTAGRFLNDMVPIVALLGGWLTVIIVDKIDYKQMIRNIKSAGGGIHGLRRGVKFLHIFGIVFIAVLVIFPNAYLALDSAVPSTKKNDIFTIEFGDIAIKLPNGAYGLPYGKEAYWVAAYDWLNNQDTAIEDPAARPGYISWWDYGFYEAAIGGHPTVADNFQDGIPPASNFHTATSEEEAVAVWVVRLLEGNVEANGGHLSSAVVEVLDRHVANDSTNIRQWIEDPTSSPSYNTPIAEEYDENLSKQWRVGEQWTTNAPYHDITEVLVDRLDDEGITWLYLDIQEATGYSIRYYGVEGYDKQIFNIFGFLADKSLLLVAGGDSNPEDDFVQVRYVTQNNKELTYADIQTMSKEELQRDPPVNTKTYYKDAYFETMFYRTYVGPAEGTSGNKQEPNYQLPCLNMRHFYAEYLSDFSEYQYYTNKGAVVIARYYAGARINGSVTFNGEPVDAQVVVQKNLSYLENFSIPIDHDKINIDAAGHFNLIAPAGEIRLQIKKFPNTIYEVILANVSFSSTTDPLYYPISDDEAMRRTESYERYVDVSIDPSAMEGYVFDSSNAPLPETSLTFYEISQTGSPLLASSATTNEQGHYNVSGLEPGIYIVTAEYDGYVIHETSQDPVKLLPGKMMYNITKPNEGEVEGTIYYDANENDEYDLGEEMSEIEVELRYQMADGTIILVDSLVTGETGRYYFDALPTANVPVSYILNATAVNITTNYPDYQTEQAVEIEENRTTIQNLSLSIAPIVVSGRVTAGGANMDNVSLLFDSNPVIENNTAQKNEATSDEQGHYTIHLTPGYYNVTAETAVNISGEEVVYTFSGVLHVKMGEGIKSFNIIMAKEET
ncbi:MAG: carboxypeptidase regulatory-like domain-containing protein [Candidatus Thermoplasmatota archaeon]|nr:carboxypeptidase regulatory-like domain-containing protein [Candidatus Thermoplasmatota archaeon]